MSETTKKYRFIINDLFTDDEKSREIDIWIWYDTLEEAKEAGWAVLKAIALLHGFGFENQGDQYMAYYDDGSEKDGWGAVTIEFFDSEGHKIEDLD